MFSCRQLIFSTLFYCEQPQAIESLNGCLSRISDGTFRPPGNLLLRRILGHFRHEIRWCFAVSAVFGKRCLAAAFLLIYRQQQQSKLEIKIGTDFASFSARN